MQYAVVALALAASAYAQSSCLDTYPGTFTFNTANYTGSSKRDLVEKVSSTPTRKSSRTPSLTYLSQRQNVACGGEGSLTLTLNGGVLLDGKGRTGYTASNNQFQFDGPPQAGAIDVDGWTVCPDTAQLTLKGEAIFWNCLSGSFYNIYNEKQGEQCNEVTIQIIPCQASTSPVTQAQTISETPSPTGSGSESEASETTSSEPENIMTEMMTTGPTITTLPVPPIVNATNPIATGTAVVPTAPSTTGTAAPSPFVGAGAVVEAGQKVVALVAGAAALALF